MVAVAAVVVILPTVCHVQPVTEVPVIVVREGLMTLLVAGYSLGDLQRDAEGGSQLDCLAAQFDVRQPSQARYLTQIDGRVWPENQQAMSFDLLRAQVDHGRRHPVEHIARRVNDVLQFNRHL